MERLEKRLFLAPQHMGGTEKDYVEQAFASNYIAPLGPLTVELEKRLSEYSGMPYARVFVSGTAAIHLALMCLNTQPGDRVICSSFTFCGTVNPVIYTGAVPVFVDSEKLSWNMDPELLEEAIIKERAAGHRIAAILAVHMYGMPYQVDKINAVAEKYGIPVVEDAAEALGSSFDGCQAGSNGTIGVYSFNGNKIITTSGGGALLTRDKATAEHAVFLATQARDPKPYYEHTRIGYNYRMSNLVAGVGCGQMEVLEERIQRKRQINQIYRQCFAGEAGISFQDEYSEKVFSNYWLTAILLDKNRFPEPEVIRQKLEEYNIESRAVWKPLHMQPVFKEMGCKVYGGKVSEDLFAYGLCLPSGTATPDNVIRDVASLVLDCVKK